MVMKVGNITPLLFRGSTNATRTDNKQPENNKIRELTAITPDFGVKIPAQYRKTGVSELPNGLKIHSYKLSNGYRVSIIPMENAPAIVKSYVNVGSMNEPENIKGISHFLEHMAFNGTNGNDGHIKLNQGDSFLKVDEMGGWTNASTNYALTDYVNATPMLDEGDLETQIKIIAAMTEDLELSKKMIEKEKFPVSSEINMILDKPETILIDQTIRSLFGIKTSADDLVGGSVKHILNLTQKDISEYYNKYYIPQNMNIVVTGEVNPDKTIELIAKHFKSTKKFQGKVYETKFTPIESTVRKDFICDKANSANIMLGFAGPKNNDAKGQVLFDIASKYLISTDAGINRALLDLNAIPELGLEKVSTNPNNSSFIYYGFDCAENVSEEALKTLFRKLSCIRPIEPNELARIKEGLLIQRDNMFNRSINVNSMLGSAIFDENLDYLTKYDEILNSIKPSDVDKFIKQYFNLNKTAITIVHPAKTDNISFKGNTRKPMNTDSISVQTLNNNIDLGLYETKNKNPYFNITYNYETPQDLKPGVKELFSIILDMGSSNIPEETFNKYLEKSNIMVISELGQEEFQIRGASAYDKFTNAVKLAKEQLYHPAINESNLEKAKIRLKDSIERSSKSSEELYMAEESAINNLYSSKKAILESLNNITVEDLKEFHNKMLTSAYATISMNIPDNDTKLKSTAIKEFSTLRTVKPNTHKIPNVYKENTQTKVLTESAPYTQADIMEIFKYPLSTNAKETAVSNIMNILLSSSATIGLFNNLREKEHLAYSVYSSLDSSGNCGELSLHILTTTDNKEIGEVSYDNLQKSINGFNKQIKALINSEYTDKELEGAKRSLKAQLLNKETINSKLRALDRGLKSEYGIDFDNQIFNEIDSVTREDIQNFASKVFKNPPIYSIVASKDTLEANKEFLESLKDKDSF